VNICPSFPFRSVAALLLGFSTQPVTAGLLYYEGFAYPAAEDGLKYQGGFAANPDPLAGVDADISEGSLRYMDSTGKVLPATGNHALIDTHEERATVSNIAPVFRQPGQLPSGGELWISFLGQQVAGTTLRFFNFSLRGPDNTLEPADSDTNMDEIFAIGMPSGADEQLWRLWDRSTGANLWTSAISTTPSTQLSLVLARIELNAVDGILERYTLWVNPPLGQAPVESEGFSVVSNDSDFSQWNDLEQVRLAAGHNAGNPSAWVVDEIRMADTWQEALPYIPLDVTVAAPAPASPAQLRWTTAPDYTESPEWSPNLLEWFPLTNPITLSGTGLATCELAFPPAGNRYFRVRRSY
jgi:hypothetical protein